MTKSFLEIAQEIADYIEMNCVGKSRGEYVAVILDRRAEEFIEAILRREFGDNNGPALERKIGSSTTDEAQIAKKFFRSSA